MSECRLIIHTATYNRANLLDRLYNSLKAQTCKDFVWAVTDDGSTDNTKELFDEWCKEDNGFKILYEKIPNGGKMRAINRAVDTINGDYIFFVDSDDYLTPNAVEVLKKWIPEIDNLDNYVGVGCAIAFPNGEYIKGVAPEIDEKIGYVDATNLERPLYKLDADMREAYKIEVLKKYPFKVWDGEKFAPEQIALNEMALAGYKIRWHKDILYIGDYLDDGLTKGSNRLLKNNPMGYAMMFNHMLKYQKGLKDRFKTAAQHIALSIVGKNPSYIFQSNAKLLTLCSLPYGIILAIRRKKQFKTF